MQKRKLNETSENTQKNKLKMRQWFGYFVFAFFLLTTLVYFQNCSKQQVSFESAPVKANDPKSIDGGNGTGYDGKVYVEIGQCADGNSIRSRILVFKEQKEAFIERENCKELPVKRQIAFDQIHLTAADDSELTYNGHIFVLESAPGKVFFQKPGVFEFQVPQGIDRIRVTVVGGGGSAGAHGAHDTFGPITGWGGGGGGGGSGGYAQSIVQVIPGQSYLGTVGSGGSGVRYVNARWGRNVDGQAGATSQFAEIVSAGGGNGGLGGFSQYGSTGNGGAIGLGGIAQGDNTKQGASGTPGNPASTVQGNQQVYHAVGGIGGSGWMVSSGVLCGKGGSGVAPALTSVAESAQDGCILIEWGF